MLPQSVFKTVFNDYERLDLKIVQKISQNREQYFAFVEIKKNQISNDFHKAGEITSRTAVL